MSDFLELSVQSREPSAENAEIITALLAEYPFDVFEHEGNLVKAFGAAVNFHENDIAAILETIGPFMLGEINTRLIPKENWNELWETHYFEPVSVDNRVRLRANFQPSDDNFEFDLVIQPKMSFGTGHHSTTQLMISLMLNTEQTFNNAEVLDMGAGTGILAVVAEKLGAKRVEAVDIEEWAAENIDENAALNHCKNIKSHHGDAALLPSLGFSPDIILANIHKQVLLQDASAYLNILKPGGSIFLSGFYSEDADDILNYYESLGCIFLDKKILNNWCAMLFRKA